MKISSNSFKICGLFLVVATLVAGCSGYKPSRPSGYLVQYDHLEPLDESPNTLYFEDKKAPWHSYHSIMFDEVTLKWAFDSDTSKLNEEHSKKMRNYFQRSMANNACAQLQFTNKPGPGVIMLRAAIVDIQPVNVAANVVSKGLFFVPVDLGRAAIEGELRDSVTGRRLVSIVDRKIGSFADPTHSYTTWGAIEDAFDSWSENLGRILEQNLP